MRTTGVRVAPQPAPRHAPGHPLPLPRTKFPLDDITEGRQKPHPSPTQTVLTQAFPPHDHHPSDKAHQGEALVREPRPPSPSPAKYRPPSIPVPSSSSAQDRPSPSIPVPSPSPAQDRPSPSTPESSSCTPPAKPPRTYRHKSPREGQQSFPRNREGAEVTWIPAGARPTPFLPRPGLMTVLSPPMQRNPRPPPSLQVGGEEARFPSRTSRQYSQLSQPTSLPPQLSSQPASLPPAVPSRPTSTQMIASRTRQRGQGGGRPAPPASRPSPSAPSRSQGQQNLVYSPQDFEDACKEVFKHRKAAIKYAATGKYVQAAGHYQTALAAMDRVLGTQVLTLTTRESMRQKLFTLQQEVFTLRKEVLHGFTDAQTAVETPRSLASSATSAPGAPPSYDDVLKEDRQRQQEESPPLPSRQPTMQGPASIITRPSRPYTLPGVDSGRSQVNASGPRPRPQVDASRPQVDASRPQVDASRPQVNVSRPRSHPHPQVVSRPRPRPHPQVDVSRPHPQVDVSRPHPQVDVSRSHPQVDVSRPHPQVDVSRPHPQIDVSRPHPQVDVSRPHPQVDVSRPHPQVDVSRPHPQVDVSRPRPRPQVDVSRPHPQVDVSRPRPQVCVSRPCPQSSSLLARPSSVSGAESKVETLVDVSEPVHVPSTPGTAPPDLALHPLHPTYVPIRPNSYHPEQKLASLTPPSSSLTTQPPSLTSSPSSLTTQPSFLTPSPSSLTTQPPSLTPSPFSLTKQPPSLTPSSCLNTQPSSLTPSPLTTEPSCLTTQSSSHTLPSSSQSEHLSSDTPPFSLPTPPLSLPTPPPPPPPRPHHEPALTPATPVAVEEVVQSQMEALHLYQTKKGTKRPPNSLSLQSQPSPTNTPPPLPKQPLCSPSHSQKGPFEFGVVSRTSSNTSGYSSICTPVTPKSVIVDPFTTMDPFPPVDPAQMDSETPFFNSTPPFSGYLVSNGVSQDTSQSKGHTDDQTVTSGYSGFNGKAAAVIQTDKINKMVIVTDRDKQEDDSSGSHNTDDHGDSILEALDFAVAQSHPRVMPRKSVGFARARCYSQETLLDHSFGTLDAVLNMDKNINASRASIIDEFDPLASALLNPEEPREDVAEAAAPKVKLEAEAADTQNKPEEEAAVRDPPKVRLRTTYPRSDLKFSRNVSVPEEVEYPMVFSEEGAVAGEEEENWGGLGVGGTYDDLYYDSDDDLTGQDLYRCEERASHSSGRTQVTWSPDVPDSLPPLPAPQEPASQEEGVDVGRSAFYTLPSHPRSSSRDSFRYLLRIREGVKIFFIHNDGVITSPFNKPFLSVTKDSNRDWLIGEGLSMSVGTDLWSCKLQSKSTLVLRTVQSVYIFKETAGKPDCRAVGLRVPSEVRKAQHELLQNILRENTLLEDERPTGFTKAISKGASSAATRMTKLVDDKSAPTNMAFVRRSSMRALKGVSKRLTTLAERTGSTMTELPEEYKELQEFADILRLSRTAKTVQYI